MATAAQNVITRYLTTDNVGGAGSTVASRMNVDGSVTPVKFYFAGEASDKRTPIIVRLFFFLQDTSGMRAGFFGDLAGALTNGIRLTVEDNDQNELLDVFDGGAIDKNAEFSKFMYDAKLDTWGPGDEFITARLSFNRFMPEGLALPSEQRLVATVRDDLTSLQNFQIFIEGYYAK